MGQGYCYKCKTCNYEYSVQPGFGMGYPKLYHNQLAAVAAGKYGPELKRLFETTPYAAINAEKVIYACNTCNRWEPGIDVSLYAPNDPDSIPLKQYGIKTVKEWGSVPYVIKDDLREDYHLLKRYYQKCKDCGRRMHKLSESSLKRLSCPKCGTVNEASDVIMWD